MSKIDLSIIIPAYNESERIHENIKALNNFLKSRNYGKVEVLIISQDPHTHRMAQLASKGIKHFRSIELRQRVGKGAAVRIGMFEATGRYRLFMDADLATPLNHLDDIHEFMDHNGDIAIAVRNINKTHTGLRKLISEFGNISVRLLLTPGIHDTQCGFKVFEAEAAKQLFGRQQIAGWAFDMEILAIARKLKYKVDIIEANDWHDPKSDSGAGLVGDSNAKAALESGIDMLKIKWRIMTGQYKRISYQHEMISS